MQYKKLLILTFLIFILLFFNVPLLRLVNKLTSNNNNMIVHYIDVGQGDCILIQVNNKSLLIDSGPNESRKNLTKYLDSLNIHTIDYVIATHPHEDHIGNMSTIIRKYDIYKFYAPKVTHNSTTFENMISALVDNNLKINVIKEGSTDIDLGEDIELLVFNPPANFTCDNLNEYSPIIKIKYKNTSFLFTGDVESLGENYALSSNYNLKSDVLKIAHHGSSTSTSKNFYDAVSPSIVIIPVGINNKYNHPSTTTLDLLEDNNPLVLRTDINGTIILNSNGNKIKAITLK